MPSWLILGLPDASLVIELERLARDGGSNVRRLSEHVRDTETLHDHRVFSRSLDDGCAWMLVRIVAGLMGLMTAAAGKDESRSGNA